MSEVDVVTVSSRGQVSIPAAVRRDLDIEAGEKLLVVSKDDNILLKKVDESFVEQSLRDILEPMWSAAEGAGLSDDDAEALIDEHRDEP
ncbi:MAG: looped-hinge helix DNA binding domain, AbrB family [Halonotius sp. J07HN6]|jgi:looped-hinge helix DNA binding domain, AbrB family|nr:MAG: looped-hinge helix DNA binding domain, AbrB family [Halonotius sp. J07HN6]ESS09897.1 MAG: looped-hinge helix DNA binding domain, AbrB family [uncultured archaeon A07HN63]